MDWKDAVQNLRQDCQHGASQLVIQALAILEDACSFLPAADCKDYIEKLHGLIAALAQARPTMVSIENTMNWFDQLLEADCHKILPLAVLRQQSGRNAGALIRYHQNSRQIIAEQALEILPPICTIITCSFSSQVLEALTLAHKREKDLRVIILESRWEGCCYGEILARKLRSAQVDCQIIPDEQASRYFSQESMIVIGGDSLLPDGWIINGYPSLFLVQSAAMAPSPVPVWALLDTLKISRKRGTFSEEEGFQAIPFSLLTGLVSEQGMILSTEEAKGLIDRPFPSLTD